jgi:hypothetical protein
LTPHRSAGISVPIARISKTMADQNKEAQDSAVKELANQAHTKPGSPEENQAKERRADAEKQLTNAKDE